MPIVDYEQDPNAPFGSGNFRDDSGRVTYLHDPETASRFVRTMPGSSLAKDVAAQSTDIAKGVMGNAAPAAQPDARLALNDTGQPVPAGDLSAPAAPNMSTDAGAPNMSVAPPAVTPAAVVETVAKAQAPAPTATPAAPSAATPSRPQQMVNAVSSAQGLPIAGISTTTVEGADRGNTLRRIKEEEGAQAKLDETRLEAGQAKDARVDQALADTSRDTRAMGGLEFGNMAQARIDKAEAERLEQLKRQELEKNDKQMDPERVLRNMSTGKRISMTILAALNGAFGALIGKKNNDVMDMLDQEIERDLQRQRDEISSGRIRIGNEIAKYMQLGLDAKTAEKMAYDRYLNAVKAVTELEGKRLQVKGENEENMRLINAEADAQMTRRRGDLLAATESKTQQTVQQAVPKAKTGLDETLKRVELEMKTLDYANKINLQKNAAQRSAELFGVDEKGQPARMLTPDQIKEIDDKVNQVGPALAETAGAVNMTKALVEKLGGRLDETSGKIKWPEDGDIEASGPIDSRGGWWQMNPVTGLPVYIARQTNLYRTAVDEARDAQNALKEYVTSNLTGANSTLRQERVFGSMVGGDLSNQDQTRENIENWTRTLFSKRHEHMNRLGEAGVRQWYVNQGISERGVDAPPLRPRVTAGTAGSSVVPNEPNMSVGP